MDHVRGARIPWDKERRDLSGDSQTLPTCQSQNSAESLHRRNTLNSELLSLRDSEPNDCLFLIRHSVCGGRLQQLKANEDTLRSARQPCAPRAQPLCLPPLASPESLLLGWRGKDKTKMAPSDSGAGRALSPAPPSTRGRCPSGCRQCPLRAVCSPPSTLAVKWLLGKPRRVTASCLGTAPRSKLTGNWPLNPP